MRVAQKIKSSDTLRSFFLPSRRALGPMDKSAKLL
jgi:hypothetical protein